MNPAWESPTGRRGLPVGESPCQEVYDSGLLVRLTEQVEKRSEDWLTLEIASVLSALYTSRQFGKAPTLLRPRESNERAEGRMPRGAAEMLLFAAESLCHSELSRICPPGLIRIYL